MDDTPPGERTSLELRDYLRVVRRRWRLLTLVTVLLGGMILAYTQTRPRVYEAEARVLLDVGYSRTIIYADSTIIPSVEEQATTELDLMRSASIQDQIAEVLGYWPEVEVNLMSSSDDKEPTRTMSVLGIGSSSSDATAAANDFARTYVTVRKTLITQDLTDTIAQNNATLASLDEQVATVEQEIADLQASISAAPQGPERRVMEARLNRLQLARTDGAISQRQDEINRRNDILQNALAVNEQGRGIFRVGLAEEPSAPVSPVLKRNLMIALAIGLAVGLAVIFLRDYYDDTFRTKEELDRATRGIPVMSMVPTADGGKARNVIESVARPQSPGAEAYRNLRTALEFASINHKIALVHVTSSLPGEGKTTTAANLAVTMANADKRVVLVDCDLRRPRVHEYFDLPNDQGFTSVLLGNCSLQDALQRPANTSNVLVLTSGPPPPNPSELLSTRTAEDLLTTLTQPADIVIVDSPPLLPVSDSIILAGYAHSTLLVVSAKTTSRRSLGRSLEMLAQIDAPLEGIVFNRVGAEASYTGGYGYGYGTYAEAASGAGRFRRRSS